MKRKLIRQGGSGLTLYVPKKWVDEHSLKPGDEVEVERTGEDLILSSQTKTIKPKEITIDLPDSREITIRTFLVNAYRAGYDRFYVYYLGNPLTLTQLVTDQLIGFEVFSQKEEQFIIESVAEPSYENFETLIQKQFFFLLQILHDVDTTPVKEVVHRVQKYDNFLKRCLTKKVLTSQAFPFLWQFLSELTHIARQCYHFNYYLQKNKIQLDVIDKKLLEQAQGLLRLLQKAYLNNDLTSLTQLQDTAQPLIYEKIPHLLSSKNPVTMYYLVSLIRTFYLATSPLTGIIQMRS
ncbi:MAG: AbrB/MazE/SpoVT family DNA-binding domain-containing protein [Nanoarchaeota archaeon]